MLQSMRSAAKYIWIAVAVFFVGGFLLLDTSGLLGRERVTNSSTIVSVNGRDVPYQTWYAATQNLAQQQEQQMGRSLTLDERQQVDQQAYEQLVGDILLEQEIRRRGITVSDDEVLQAAQFSPPPQLLQSPELQTDGRFDPDKYRRFLQNPAAKQSGLLRQLEDYYRSEIPRSKLYQQVAGDVYVTDERLWQIYKDGADSAEASYVVLRADSIPDSTVTVTDQEIRAYFDKSKQDIVRPGQARVSVLTISRAVTAADSAAARARAEALRSEIAGGAKFEDVARRESIDSVSASQGGSLGKYVKGGGFVKPFEDAAFALPVGELSQPVLSPFGYHVIRVDSKQGDTLTLRHILLPITQSEASATAADNRADSLVNLAGSGDDPKKFDQAAKTFGLPIRRGLVVEGGRLVLDGQYIPSVSAWAFGGAKPGETSELFEAPDGYFLARLDSLTPGGAPRLENTRAEIQRYLAREKKLDRLMTEANQVTAKARATTLESAAQGANLQVQKTPTFTRVTPVEGLGRFSEAVGAAFATPVGKVSPPIRTTEGIYILRVERRVEADRKAFDAQKAQQRQQVTGTLRDQRVRDFLADLRKSAKIKDNRKELLATGRAAES